MITRRRVKAECREAFEVVLRSFVAVAVKSPGHLDIYVLSRIRDHNEDFAIAHRFLTARARRAFTSSPEYRAWLGRLQELTDETPNDKSPRQPVETDEVRAPMPVAVAGFVGIIVFFGIFLLLLSLPPVVYFFLRDWNALGRGAISMLSLAALLGWLLWGRGKPASEAGIPRILETHSSR